MNKYFLHFVGSKLYPKEIFIEEAKKHHINRCIPMKIIKKLKWGDTILLGTFKPNENFKPNELCPNCKTVLEHTYIAKENQEINLKEKGDIYNCPTCQVEVSKEKVIKEKLDRRKNKKNGTAEVFGYFQINGLNIEASDEYQKLLTEQLDITSTNDVHKKVQRRCGSYSISSSHVIKNSIEDIITKATDLANKRQEKVKFFIAGKFKPLTLTLHPVNFSRVITKVKIKENITSENLEGLEISFIYDYSKRRYIKKYAKRGRPRKIKNV